MCRVCPRRGTGSTILCVEKGRQCGMWDGSLGRGLPVLVGCGRGLRLTAPLTLEHCFEAPLGRNTLGHPCPEASCHVGPASPLNSCLSELTNAGSQGRWEEGSTRWTSHGACVGHLQVHRYGAEWAVSPWGQGPGCRQLLLPSPAGRGQGLLLGAWQSFSPQRSTVPSFQGM